MNDQLDRTVRTVLADIVATTPPLSDLPERLLPVEGPARNRRPVFAIAAAEHASMYGRQRIERDLEVWLVRLDHRRDFWDHDRLGRAILLLRSPGGPSEATHEPAGHALALNAPRRCLAGEHGREQESVHPGNETRVARHRHAHPSLRNRCGRRASLSGNELRHRHCAAVAARIPNGMV